MSYEWVVPLDYIVGSVLLADDVFAAAANALGVGVVEYVNEWLA